MLLLCLAIALHVSVRRAPFLTAYGVATSIRFGSRAERSKLPKPQP